MWNRAVFILREKVEKIKVYDDSSIENMYEREKIDRYLVKEELKNN